MAIFNHLAEVLDKLDNDMEVCCHALNTPESRVPLIYDILDSKMPGDNDFWSPDRPRDKKKHAFLFSKLEDAYHKYAWACHDCHFHVDFYTYASCPFTSLCELAELARKLSKEWPNL